MITRIFFLLLFIAGNYCISSAQTPEIWVKEGLSIQDSASQIAYFTQMIAQKQQPIWKAYYYRSKAELPSNIAKAVADCDSALIFSPFVGDIYFQRGTSYQEWAVIVTYNKALKEDLMQKAKKDFEKAASMGDAQGEATLKLATIHIETEKSNRDSIVKVISQKAYSLATTDTVAVQSYSTFLEKEGGYVLTPDTATNREHDKGGKPTLETTSAPDIKADSLTETQRFFNEANEKKRHGKYNEAIQIYTKAIEKKADSWEAYNNRGVAKLEKGDYDGALKDFEYIIEQTKGNSWAENNIGCVKYELGAYIESLRQFQKAIKLDTLNATAYYNLGMVMHLLDKYEAAMTNFNKAIGLRKPLLYPNAHLARGEVELDLGMENEANDDFEKVLSFSPQTADEYVTHGAANYALRRYESAISDCNKAEIINPLHTHTYLIRGKAKEEMREYWSAIEDFTKGLSINNKLYALYNARAWAYYESGNDNKAEEDFTMLLKLQKDSVFAFYGLGNLKKRSKDYAKAHLFADNSIKLRRNFSHAYNLKGNIEVEHKRYQKAIPYFNEAIHYNASSFAFYLSRGWAHYELNQYEEARKDAYTSLKLRKTENAYRLLSAIETQKGNYALAHEWVRKAFLLDADDPDNYNQKGNVYLKQAYFSDSIAKIALNCYDKAITLDKYRTYYGYYSNRADAELILKDTLKAIKDLEEAIKIAPKEADNYEDLGDLYIAKKKYGQAIAPFEAALKWYEEDSITQEIVHVCKKLGNTQFMLLNYQAAFLCYNKAFYYEPGLVENKSFMTNYAISAYQCKRCKKAWEIETEINKRWGIISEVKQASKLCIP